MSEFDDTLPREKFVRWPTVVVMGLLAIAACSLLWSALAHGAPPAGADPRMEPFYKSLKTEHGGDCCGAADCREVDSRHDPKSAPEIGWQVFVDKKTFDTDTAPDAWVDVPPRMVHMLREDVHPRPARAVACWMSVPTLYYMETKERLICFRPPEAQD